ncbi:MAG TPA: DUF5939 domain-containing protein [Candidatus Wallbacteria bacterium]|nr:DUF5939 domain-containing protein [Candidatus Wallbacteria bacterium]
MNTEKLSAKAVSLIDALETSRHCEVAAVSAIKKILASEKDFDCYKINAFRVAFDAGVENSDMLRAFLYATKLGLFDLNWDIHCPSCHGIPDYHKHLMGLKKTAHCDLCAINWDLDFEEQVEVTFTVNPDIRKIEYADWSARHDFASKMQFLDDILNRENRDFTIGACVYKNDTKTFSADFEHGRYIYYMPSHMELGGFLEVSQAPSQGEQNFNLAISASGRFDIQRIKAFSGRINFIVTSDYPDMNGFLVKPVAPRNNWVSAAYVTSQQEFRDLFSTEFLSPDTSFAIKNTTFMFTDIKGSTELYEEIGDSAAFAAVKEHFKVLIDIIRKYEGGVVKTIGDAVMAAFPVNSNAVVAACEIQSLFSSCVFRKGEIKVKIGLHRGGAITVTSNKSLDYFGRTVNIAARVQGKSDANEVLMTESVINDQAVRHYFSVHNFTAHEHEVTLKGIDKPIMVFSINFGGAVK